MGALITAKENFHAVSLSGGKDSTCLLLLMIERGLPIDAVIWADTGMEFPEMYGHISKVDEHLYRERGLHITTLRSPKSFEYMMFDEPKQKPSTLENRARLGVPPYGNGWPGIKVRWCTGQLKTHQINKELTRLKGQHRLQQYVGIAADDVARLFQLTQRPADGVHALLADGRKAPCGVIPLVRQGEHHGQQPLGFQTQGCVLQVVVAHYGIVQRPFYAENCHVLSLPM